MCGNPRKNYRGYRDATTLQEKKSIDWHNGKFDVDGLAKVTVEVDED